MSCDPTTPPKSRRARILTNLQRQLKTISKANGYATDIVDVTTKIENWDLVPSANTPVIFIVDMGSTPIYHAGKLTEWSWRIHLTGLMKNETQIAMEEMVSDMQDCLFKNGTLAFDSVYPGPSAQIRVVQIITDGQLMHEIDGSQLFTLTIDVKYTGDAFISR